MLDIFGPAGLFMHPDQIFLYRLPILCEKSGATALVLPDLTAGWLADEIVLNLKIF